VHIRDHCEQVIHGAGQRMNATEKRLRECFLAGDSVEAAVLNEHSGKGGNL